jgi:hypothetical protein
VSAQTKGELGRPVDKMSEIPKLIRELYEIVERLETLFPGRRFTPDGHLVGSIGEVLAAHYYGLELLTASAEAHDAQAADGRLVQIKATQRRSVGLRSKPEHLLVLRILPGGDWEEVYNGPGKLAWDNAGKMQSTGQRPISVSRLIALMGNVSATERLPKAVP